MGSEKRMNYRLMAILLFNLVLLNSSELMSDDWPQWRGLNRDGISKETGLINSWPKNGPEILWRIPANDGYSAAAVSKDKLFVMWAEDKNEVMVSLDANSGRVLWKHKIGPLYTDDWGSGPRAAPVVDGDAVFGIGAYGRLHAVNAVSGKPLWSHDLVKEYETRRPHWGYAGTPVVYQNKLLVEVGGRAGHAFMAFDKKTGAEIWKSETDTLAYSSPVIFNIHNKNQAVFFSRRGLVSLDPDNGRKLWHYDWPAANIANPIFIAPDKIFISSSYEKGSALVKINKNNSEFSAETVWKSGVMKNHINSCVLVGDYLYGFDNAVLRCINANTGGLKWSKRRLGRGSLIYADGKLIVLGEKGKLVLLKADPEKYNELTKSKILKGRCWTPPALADGRLYLRSRKELVCVNLKEKK